MRLCFVDTETTSLSYETGEVWEVACIVRDEENDDDDVEHHWFLPVGDLKKADPFALNIGKFWERHPQALYTQQDNTKKERKPGYKTSGWDGVTDKSAFAHDFWRLSKDAILVAAVPDFDAWRIGKIIKEHTQLFPMWHYHLVCVENLAAGALKMQPPWKSDNLYEALGYKRNVEDRHSALGDAREVRDIYDLVMLGNQ